MRRYTLQIKDKIHVVDVQELSPSFFRVVLDDEEFNVQLTAEEDLAEAAITPEMIPVRASSVPVAPRLPAPETFPAVLAAPQPSLPQPPQLPSDGFRAELTAPMPGTILSIEVKAGDPVQYGQKMVVLEAMKMKNAIKAPQDGMVAEVFVQPGQLVSYGDLLLRMTRG